MSFIFDEKIATNPLGENQWSTGDRTGFKEVYNAALDANFASDRTDSRHRNMSDQYSVMTDLLYKEGHTNVVNPIKTFNDFPLGPEDPDAYEIDDEPYFEKSRIDKFWNQVDEIKKANPEFAEKLRQEKFDTQEALEERIAINTRELWSNFTDVAKRGSGSWYSGGGKTGSWVGSMAALGTDPTVLATLPIGALYSVPAKILPAVLKVARIEAMIGFATEVVIQTQVQPYRKELGLESGLGLAAKNVAMVTAFSGTLGGVLTGAIKGTPIAYAKIRAELNRLPDKKVEELSEVLGLDKNLPKVSDKQIPNPYKDDKTGINLANERLDAATKAVVTDTKLDLPEAKVSLNNKELEKLPSNLARYKVDDVEFDPKNFQYKVKGVDKKTGLSKKLANITEWDEPSAGAIVVYEFRNGKTAVVDGHQRLGLAKKLGVKNINATVFREADGITPEAAKLRGLLINLRNNTGSAADAAVVLRSEYNIDVDNLLKSLPMRLPVIQQALGLTKLSDDAWGMWKSGKFSDVLAAKIGEFVQDKTLHAKALSYFQKVKFDNAGVMDLTLQQYNKLPKTVTKQETLFGKESFAETNIVERSTLINWASRNFKKNSQVFKTIAQNDATLQAAGNKLNKLRNIDEAEKNNIIQSRLAGEALYEGQLSRDLDTAANLLKAGNRSEAEQAWLKAISDAADRGDFTRSITGGYDRVNQTTTEGSSLSQKAKFEEDLKSDKLFSDPGGQGVKDQADELAIELVGEEIPSSIKTRAEASLASRTSDAEKLAGSQDLEVGTQLTTSEPPSSVFASATTTPPRFLGDTSGTKIVGDTNAITNKRILHKSNDTQEIYNNLSAKKQELETFLKAESKEFKGKVSVRVKDLNELKSKINTKDVDPSSISDYLGGRVIVESLDGAKKLLDKIKAKSRLIEVEDFLNDGGRQTGYRAIHVQMMDADGFSSEIQIRLGALEDSINRAAKTRSIFKNKILTAEETAQMIKAEKEIKVDLDNTWHNYKNKDLAEAVDENAVVAVGVKENEDGSKIVVSKTVKEILEEEADELSILERLKDCQ